MQISTLLLLSALRRMRISRLLLLSACVSLRRRDQVPGHCPPPRRSSRSSRRMVQGYGWATQVVGARGGVGQSRSSRRVPRHSAGVGRHLAALAPPVPTALEALLAAVKEGKNNVGGRVLNSEMEHTWLYARHQTKTFVSGATAQRLTPPPAASMLRTFTRLRTRV